MKRILVLFTVAAMMALGVAGQAWADPANDGPGSDHNCAGQANSDFAPVGTSKGDWGTYIQPIAHNQQADEEAHKVADDGNCGGNNVP
jgi:hypothetical protein